MDKTIHLNSEWESETPNPDMLSLARDVRGMSVSDMAEAMQTLEVIIERWESGTTVPTSEDMRRISDILGFPMKFFFQPGKRYPSLCTKWHDE